MLIPFLEFAFTGTPPPFIPTLTSSALSPEQIASIFQPIIAQILGFPATPPYPWGAHPGAQSWYNVRVGWQQDGQPAWDIGEDVCVITATITNDPYSRVRVNAYEQNDAETLVSQMGFTQVWNMHFTVYGPNSYRNANWISSAMALDWVHDALAQQTIYEVVEYNRPINNPENFQGQWWQRVDLDLKFNYAVTESVTVPSAASVDVTLVPQPGASLTFKIVSQ